MISAKLSLELSMNGCRKAKVIISRNIEYNSKINIFLQEILALLKSIHVKNVIEKKLPDLVFDTFLLKSNFLYFY